MNWLWITSILALSDIRIGFMTPYIDCPTCLAAFMSTIDYLDQTSSLNVTGEFRDSQNRTSALRGALEMNVDMIIADLYSSRVEISSRMATIRQIPMIGYGSTSDAFSNKVEYPEFSRVVSPDIYQTTALVAAIRDFGWERIAILFSNEAYGTNYVAQLTTASTNIGLIIHTQKTFTTGASVSEIEPLIRQIMASQARVIILVAVSSDVTNVFSAAYNTGAYGSEYTWIGSDGAITAELYPSGTNALFAANGMLGIFPQYIPTSDQARLLYEQVVINQTWKDQLPDLPNITDPFNPWAYYVRDATFFVFEALRDGCDNSTCLRFRNMSGATGTFSIDQNGDRSGSYSIVNLQMNTPDFFIPVGNISITENVSQVQVNRRRIVWASGRTNTLEIPDDGDFSNPTTSVNLSEIIAPIIIVFFMIGFVCGVMFYRYRRKMKLKRQQEQARTAEERRLKEAEKTRADEAEKALKAMGTYRVATQEFGSDSVSDIDGNGRAIWMFCETQQDFLSQHDSKNISNGWIPYDDVTISFIEDMYTKYQVNSSTPVMAVKIKTPIGERLYAISVAKMTQTSPTGRVLKIRRVESVRKAASVASLENMKAPDWLIAENEPILHIIPGMMMSMTNERDGWYYGTSMYHQDRNVEVGKSGWYPKEMSDVAPVELQMEFKNSMADGIFEYPKNWTNTDQMSSTAMQVIVDPKSNEFKEIQHYFNQGLRGAEAYIVRIYRNQNAELWPQYNVTRSRIESRPNKEGYQMVSRLWHGTRSDVIDNILQQGFNRIFGGYNATMYGIGVYFATWVGYSLSGNYAQTDKNGICHIILAYVAHGRYCLGKKDARTPDVYQGNQLYDSTTDNMDSSRRNMFVTFNDAQTYPAYHLHVKLGKP